MKLEADWLSSLLPCGHDDRLKLVAADRFGASIDSDGVLGRNGGSSGLSRSGGVVGDSNSNDGVVGLSSGGNGITGISTVDSGVYGTSSASWGVLGSSQAEVAGGVWGADESEAGAFGVQGTTGPGVGVAGSAESGIGVSAQSASGTALKVEGVATFTRSGLVSIPADKVSVTVTGVALSTASLVLATMQNSVPKVYVEAVIPNVGAGSFEILLSKKVPNGKAANVGWFIVN